MRLLALLALLLTSPRVEGQSGKPSPLPVRVDNSKHPAFPPVIQQQTNSCSQQTAAYYILTYHLNLARGQAADSPARRISPLHPWNFLNAAGNNGTEFPDAWCLARRMGLPSVEDAGTPATGHWMHGYDKYHRAMRNRAASWKLHPLSTPANLRKAKAWLHNQWQPGSPGGLLALDFQFKGDEYATIPENLPGAGKTIVTQWGRRQDGHLMTCVGYDDEVGHDFNGDGKITNHLDITGDGKIDLADWEKGCFILANSWGTGWANGGFVYSPYREHLASGWDRAKWAGLVRVEKDHQPRLTLRLLLASPDRDALILTWGLADRAAAPAPQQTRPSPLFRRRSLLPLAQPGSPEKHAQYTKTRYLLGKVPLRGPGNPEPLEIGFDLTGFCRDFHKDTQKKPAKFFLLLHHDSPKDLGARLIEAELRFYAKDGQLQRTLPLAPPADTLLPLPVPRRPLLLSAPLGKQ